MSFVVIDIETTGLSKHYHRITEIAAARVKNGEIVQDYQTLVNPETPIPRFITKLTGITNTLVQDAPVVKEVLPSFLKFLGDDVFVAHNATFDHGFLETNATRFCRTRIPNHKLCTRKLATRLLPDVGSKSLGSLCNHFKITNTQAHRALGDVYATVGVLNNFLGVLKKHKISEPQDIVSFSNMPVRRAMQCMCQNDN